ncbi:MAG: citrate lyase holo-[acyl-carrier protein] synthase [Peptoniphilaceae bacterium]|nr:citrate lyase holo-[acyl-carrier protein] synthase [Peptoniphilaceae bacterium]MDY6019545.1 citrate lyase holo-[acyl-carrier protein] synthase [Anaerococcus sp.]
MKIKYLNSGLRPSLAQVLDRREEKQNIINELDRKYNDNASIFFTLNIPGPVKNNSKIEELFSYGKEKIIEEIKKLEINIIYKKEYSLITGPELYLSVFCDEKYLKSQMCQIEDSKLGRLFDIDVYKNGCFISRREIGVDERKCFLCNKKAKICARSRAHSIDKMLIYIEKIMDLYL